MKFALQAVLGLSLLSAVSAFAAATASPAQSMTLTAAPTATHVKAVQDLFAAMQVEKMMRGVVARTRYPSEVQRQALSTKFEQTPPAVIYQRLAGPMARLISADTAAEMTRFYHTPYGKQLIYRRYNSSAQIMLPGGKGVVSPEEKKEQKRAAYVKASKELAAAEPYIEREAFKLLQLMSKEKR